MPSHSRVPSSRVFYAAARPAALLLSVLLLTPPSFLHAAGTTSAAFLQLGTGARASAMGDAFSAVADDASATHWNPAGLSFLRRQELLAEHSLHLQDISIERLAFVRPFGARQGPASGALGVSVSYLHLAGIEARAGNTPTPDRLFGASDMVSAVSYSRPLSRRARRASSVGVSAKYIQQRIDDRRADATAADVGVLQQFGPWHVGAVLANVGADVKFINESYPLPRTLRAGVSYEPRAGPLTLALGAEKLRGEGGVSYRLGTEYRVGQLLSFRLGYLTRPGPTSRALKGAGLGTVSDGEMAKVTGMVGGLGFRLFNYGVDYAFTPYGDLGNTHKISLSARF